MKAGWFNNLALGQQCALAVPGDFSVPERVTTPFTVGRVVRIVPPRTSHPKPVIQIRVLVSGRGAGQRIRVERKLFNVVLS